MGKLGSQVPSVANSKRRGACAAQHEMRHGQQRELTQSRPAVSSLCDDVTTLGRPSCFLGGWENKGRDQPQFASGWGGGGPSPATSELLLQSQGLLGKGGGPACKLNQFPLPNARQPKRTHQVTPLDRLGPF